jgi:hypothetical protein
VLPLRRQARIVADAPDELTSTTWVAVTPEGTLQVGRAGAGFGAGFMVDAARAGLRARVTGVEGASFRLAEVAAGGGALVVVDLVGEVLVGVVARALVLVLDDTLVEAASGAPLPHAARNPDALRATVMTIARVRITGRSAGSRGWATGRPNAAPGT